MNNELNEEDEALVEDQANDSQLEEDSANDDAGNDDASSDQSVTSQEQPDSEEEVEGETEPDDQDSSDSDVNDVQEFEPEFDNDILVDHVRRAIAPIAGGDPCGESEEPAASVISQIETTGDGIHEALRVAFGEAVRDDNLSAFDMSGVGREADSLVDQIIDCLAEKCKSIVLASYLPHLMLIMYGPEGFEAGLTIIRELTLQYGDNVFPRDREKLGGFLRRGVYIGNDDKVTDNYKLFLYTAITEPENLPYALLRNARLKGTGNNVEGQYSSDASRSSVEFYVGLVGAMEGAVERAREANAALGELLGDPTFEVVSYSFVDSIERMTKMIHSLATDNCAGYPPVEDEEVEEASVGVAAGAPQIAHGEIVDREQAIKMLGKIADFFYKTERHSPISYRIRDTVSWCKMDFPELLQLLLDGDENSLSEMQKRVGFNDPSQSQQSESYGHEE